MTDKQIIIDGVDVADCEHINACDKKMKCVILQDDICETNPYCEGFNCYYKQLKRKEQECEELKESNISLIKDWEEKKNLAYEIACKNEKLKQTLTEIKKIAEPYQKDIDKICGNCRRYDGCHTCCMDTLNNYEYRTGTTKACDKFIELNDFDINKLANQILQKISECEANQ